MDLQLAGKKALITGASMGIGKAIALSLASEGCDVALCARDKSRLDLSADEIRGKTGRTVFTIAADLARAADALATGRDLAPAADGLMAAGEGGVFRAASLRLARALRAAG